MIPDDSSPSRSLQNSNFTSSPSGSKVLVPSRYTVAEEASPVRETSMTASGISLYSSTLNVHETGTLIPSEA